MRRDKRRISWVYAAAAADAVFVFKEQKTELLLKITEKPIRRGKWLSKLKVPPDAAI